MANDCLITKFKGEVDGNLPIFGALPIYVKATGTCNNFTLPSGKTFTLVHPDGTEEQVSGNIASKFVANGEERKFYLLDYLYRDYALPTAGLVASGISPNNLAYIKAEDLKSEVTKDVGELTYLGPLQCPIQGNLSDIFKFSEPNLNAKTFAFRVDDWQLTGSSSDFIEFFSKMPNVESIIWGNGSWIFNFSDLAQATNGNITDVFGYGYSGDIYQFVQKARSQGRTEGTAIFSWFNKNNTCTLDGDSVPHSDIYGAIIWTSDSISVYGGASSSVESMTLRQTWDK